MNLMGPDPKVLRPVLSILILLVLWQVAVFITNPPVFLLPGPLKVLATLWAQAPRLSWHALVTLGEIAAGMVIGGGSGILIALLLSRLPRVSLWVMPLLIGSQAIPVFALAPLLSLWFGYGFAAKVAMTTLIIYFPVVSCFYDGLRRTPALYLDLGRSLSASRSDLLWRIQVPAALPALVSGFKLAAVSAPIGAVVGEWVGASAGLGYLMLHANGRMQTDVMFAALFVLISLGITLYALTAWIGKQLVPYTRHI